MKNNLIYLLLLLLVVGCSKDDEDSIVGSYRMTAISQSNCSDALANFAITFGEDGCGTFATVEFCTTGTFTFSADGNFTSTVKFNAGGLGTEDLSATGTYTVTGTTVEICAPDCGSLTISGNTLTQTEDTDDCDQSLTLTKI